MQEIKIYLVLATIIWLWIDNMGTLLNKVDGVRFVPRNELAKFLCHNKPFNCGVCLSFWAGIIATLLTGEILFLTLPVTFKLLNKTL